MRASTIKVRGAMVIAGAVAWAAGWVIGPPRDGTGTPIENLGALAFQLGLFAILLAMRGTNAVGAGRWGRAVLAVQTVLLSLATVWTITYAISPSTAAHDKIMITFDTAWPLSMAWLVPLAVTVIVARWWPSPARFLPLPASLWLVADLAASAAGQAVFTVVHVTCLLGAYGWLGVALIRDVAGSAADPVTGGSSI